MNVSKRPRIFYGWIVVAVAFVTMAVSVNARTGYSLLFPAISAEFGWSSATISGAFALGFLCSSAFIPVAGMVMDRYGPRIAIPMSALLVVAGYVGCMFATSPLMLYVFAGLMAVVGSLIMSYTGHSMFLPNWFVRKRGLATGIAFGGVGVGAVFLLPALQWVIESEGWRAGCLAIAGTVAVIVIPLNLAFQRLSPQSMGLFPDGDEDPAVATRPAPPDAIVDRDWVDTEWTVGKALFTTRFWWIGLAYFCGLFVWYGVQIHQTKFLLAQGIGAGEAATALGLVALFGIFGQVFIGGYSDRAGREIGWSLALLGFFFCSALLLALESAPGRGLLYAMVATQGLLGYGVASLYGPITADVFGGKSFSRIFSVLVLFGNTGAAAGVFFLGIIDDSTGGYTFGWWLCLLASLVSIAAVWMAAPRRVRLVAGQAARRVAAVEAGQ